MDTSSLTPSQQVKVQFWLNAIHECRASGLTNSDWCMQNNLSLKSYYYWLARIRKMALEDIPHKSTGKMLPCRQTTQETVLSHDFTEIPGPASVPVPCSPVIIHAGDMSIEVSDSVSQELLISVLKAVRSC